MRKTVLLLCLIFCILFNACSGPAMSESEPIISATRDQDQITAEPTASSTHIVNAEPSIERLYFTDLPKQLSPKNLLVLVFNYNNGYFEQSDEFVESAWADYIFGTGSYEDGTASINDYFKEISNGQFYYNPILIGDNTTGVYSFHLDKDYSDEQGLHPEWPFFEFQYDMMQALDSLIEKELDINPFAATGIDHSNYYQKMIGVYDFTQEERPTQWFETSTLLCVFPTYNMEKMDLTPLSSSADQFTLYTHINQNSSFGVIAHELGHTLGAVDVYNFGSYASDLMSHACANIPEPYNVAHINPFYKIIFGWATPLVVTESTDMTLYPATSDQYKPVIVRTHDGDQYYIIENRKSEKFDTGIDITQSDGINVWRIDKLGCEAIYQPRKGISIEGILRSKGESVQLNRYASNDVDTLDEDDAGITIQYINSNADGSINVSISFS